MAALALLVVVGALCAQPAAPSIEPGPEPRVLLHGDDSAITGALAVGLVDTGVIVTASRDDATHEVTVARRDGSWVLVCEGGETRGASVDDGPPALLEIELRHRVRALLRQTPPRTPTTAGVERVALQAYDRSAVGDRFVDDVAAALLGAGVSLAPDDHAAALLCVDAADDVITVAWGPAAGPCDGRAAALERRTVAGVVVAEALRLREAARLANAAATAASSASATTTTTTTTTTTPAATTATDTATATPAATIATGTTTATTAKAEAETADAPSGAGADTLSLALRGGALGRPFALDALLEASAFVPVWGDLGVVAVGAGSGVVEPLPIVEVALAAGPAWRVDLSDDVRGQLGLAGGVWMHGWSWDAADAGIAFDPALFVPASIDARLGRFAALSFGVSAGVVGRSRLHRIGGEIGWERGAVFAAITGGLAFDLPLGAGGSASGEKSAGLARGEGR